jgi:hypothetical protein
VLRASGSLPVDEPRWVQEYRDKIVQVAQSQLHVREATGDNDGPDIKKYLAVTGLPEGHPWCAAFTSWVFREAGSSASPRSARVVDWFDANIVYKREWRRPVILPRKGMVVGLYYERLGRYGHIAIVAQDEIGSNPRSCVVISGNTNLAGSREGDGVYRKIYPWPIIAVMSDYCLAGRLFMIQYEEKLKEATQ